MNVFRYSIQEWRKKHPNYLKQPIMKEPKTHVLKCWPEHFQALRSGAKTCEARLNDRDFKVGEFLLLAEYEPETDTYTEQTDVYKITHVLHGGQFGIEKGCVVMSLEA